jgi:hypothetical protein
MTERDVQLPSPTSVPHFLAKQIGKHAGALAEEELAEALQEIELETQIDGASFIKVSVLDPEGALQESGFFDPDTDGLLPKIEVEFPEESGWFWRFCAMDGSNDPTQPVVLTFEDRIVAYLRDHVGQRGVPPGTTTRAQFIKALVDEVGLGGKVPRINFVCPSLNVKQPVASSEPGAEAEGTTTVSTAIDQGNAQAKANKGRGVAAGAAITIKGTSPTSAQLALINEALGIANELNSGQLATEALIEACIAENDFSDSGEGLLQVIPFTAASLGISDTNVKQVVTDFLTKGYGGKGGAIEYARKHPSAPAHEVAQAVQASGAGLASNGASNYGPWEGEAKAIIAAGGGVKAGGTASTGESDVGQLTRGTTGNPYEDSWETIARLKAQVNWFAFTNGNNLFYMDGPDLIAQKPSLYLDVWANKVTYEKGSHKVEETGVIQTGLTYTFDNTAFIYSAKKKKAKGKVEHKSKIAKPRTPSQVRLNLVCEITAFRAGDVFVFQKGPLKGRWVVATATRKCLAETFTTFLLEPPIAPTAEPLGAGKEAQAPSFGSSPVAGAARKALAEKSKYRYVYGGGRQSGADLFGAEPREMDCSSFAILCYKAAQLPDPSGANYSSIGTTQTLIENMTKTSAPQPGDLCFFGTLSHTTHVTVYVGGGNAVSMGKEGDPEEGPAETTGPSGFLGYYTPKLVR